MIIVTRPEPDGRAFVERCINSGINAVSAPLMHIEIMDRKMSFKDDEALAFTSANGVRAFAHNHEERGFRVYAVGSVTAEAARRRGISRCPRGEGRRCFACRRDY